MHNRELFVVCAGLLILLSPHGASAMDECDAALQRYLLDDTKITDRSSRNLAFNSAACAEDSASSGGSAEAKYELIGGSADYQEVRKNKRCESNNQSENMARFYAYASRSIKSELVQAWSQCKAQRVDGLFCDLQSDNSPTTARLRVVWRDADQATVTSSTTYLMNLLNRTDRSVFNKGTQLPYGVSEFIVEKAERDVRKEGQVVINVTSGHKAAYCSAVWPPYKTSSSEEGPECSGLRTKINAAFGVLRSVAPEIMNCWQNPDSACQTIIAAMGSSDRDTIGRVQRMLMDAIQPVQGLSKEKLLDLYGACSISENYGRLVTNICINENPSSCIPTPIGMGSTTGGPLPIPVPRNTTGVQPPGPIPLPSQ